MDLKRKIGHLPIHSGKILRITRGTGYMKHPVYGTLSNCIPILIWWFPEFKQVKERLVRTSSTLESGPITSQSPQGNNECMDVCKGIFEMYIFSAPSEFFLENHPVGSYASLLFVHII